MFVVINNLLFKCWFVGYVWLWWGVLGFVVVCGLGVVGC